MKYNPDRHHRRSIRLKGYDYSQPGAYFVTICVEQRQCLFGDVVDGQMILNQYGMVVADTYQWLCDRYPYLYTDEWIVMPNHFHAIMIIADIPPRTDTDIPRTDTDIPRMDTDIPRTDTDIPRRGVSRDAKRVL